MISLLKTIPQWGWWVIAFVVYVFGEYGSKLWAMGKESWFFPTVIAFIIGTIAWMGVMTHRNQLFVSGLLWQVSGLLSAIVVSLAVFGEKLTTIQWIGAVLVIFGTFFLNK